MDLVRMMVVAPTTRGERLVNGPVQDDGGFANCNLLGGEGLSNGPGQDDGGWAYSNPFQQRKRK